MSVRARRHGTDLLVGRAVERAAVHRFVEGLGSGGGALLLSGEPGVGKTAVLRSARYSSGIDVVETAGSPFTAVSFGALQRPLERLSDQRRLLGAAHRQALDVALGFGPGPPPSLLVVGEATLEMLRAAAMNRPLLFVADDLQWLDPASSRVLGHVARRLSGSRIGFLGAFRTGQAGFFERSGLRQLELEPLDPASAEALLDSRFPDLAAPVRAHLLAQAQGNPLALIELPTVLLPGQRTGHATIPDHLPLTQRLQEVYASAVSRLDPPSRRLLLIAALDGSEDLRVQMEAADADLDAFAGAEQAGLLRVDVGGGRVSFRHPLIRAAVVDLAGADERRSAHAALAGAMVSQPERAAWHLAEATQHPDETVAGQLEAAGRLMLRRGDAVAAVRTLLLASDLTPDAASRRRRLTEAAYVGADVTGGLHAGARLMENGRRESSPDGSLATALLTAYLLLNGDGNIASAHQLLASAIENGIESGDDPTMLVEALHTLQLICFFGGRASLWRPFQAAIARLGDLVPPSLSLTSRTMADPARTAASALPELEAAISGLQRETDPSQIVRIGMASFHVDRIADCRHALRRVVRDGRAGGAVSSAINALLLIACDDLVTGQWTDAGELSGEALRLSEAYGYQLLSWPGRLVGGLLAAARGEDDVVRSAVDDMLDWSSPRGVRTVQHYAHHVQASAALARGDFALAFRHAAEISPAGTYASHVAHALPVSLDLVEAAARAGHREAAAAHARAMHEQGIWRLSPRLAFLSAGATALAAPAERAADRFHEALALPGASRWPFEYARLQLAFGEQLRGWGDDPQAIPHLQAAWTSFRRLQARPWALRTAVQLRAVGIAAPGSPAREPVPLTEQDLEIVRLAAAGLTNKEIGRRMFLSHRTVGAHLYRAFPKLGVTSRAALRDALAELPGQPGRE